MGLVVRNAFILPSNVFFSTTIILPLSAGNNVGFLECNIFILLFVATAPSGQGPLHSRGF
jgi:hypothetical protein